MIGRGNRLLALSMGAIVVLSGSVLAGTVGVAQALLISEEEHWKYHINKWGWDEDRRRTYGLISPQIIIQNETVDRLEGYVADANGTRLGMYDGQQIVHVRFMSDSSIATNWQIAGRVHDGYFAIDIPEKYKQAEIVKIYIGNHFYNVDNGTPATPQTQVYINSAILNFKTGSTLDRIETEVAQETKPIKSVYMGDSLIDWILSQNGMLPVRSPDSGK